jgi:rare lipoprotein A
MRPRLRAIPFILSIAIGAGAAAWDAPAAAQPADAAQRPGPAIAGWRTSVAVEPSPSAASGRGITTSALPPIPGMRSSGLGEKHHDLQGIASYYWQSQKTANGEVFDKMALTAAHRSLPFGTRVRVTNITNQRSVTVRINDRGPFKPGRVIDLSYAAAGEIGMRAQGLARVVIEVLR